MKNYFLFSMALLVLFQSACGSSPQTIADAVSATVAAMPSQTVYPTYTSYPTYTPYPSPTLLPTDTPLPTEQPTETPLPVTPTAVPEPVIYKGSGDSVIDLDMTIGRIGILHVVGNSASRYFGVSGFDKDGNRTGAIVNTTDPYDGYRPLNFTDQETTIRLEITASGEWEVTHFPFVTTYLHQLAVPGTITGKGDDVLFLTGSKPDILHVAGNSGSNYFGLIGYTVEAKRESLVNTTDSYDGNVIAPSGLMLLEIIAVGDWTIEVTAK